MNDLEKILSDQIRSLLIVLEDLAGAIDWTRFPEDYRETVNMAVQEAREALGLGDDCAAGACRL